MQKGILTLSNAIWNAKRRYKVNSVVKFGNAVYQNSTGRNSSPDLLIDWVLIKGDVSGTTQLRESRQIYNSGAQEFTLPEAAAQIVLVTVNGTPFYDYTVLSDTLVRVDLPLTPTVRVVIHYLVDLNLDIVPYYTQLQVDAIASGKVDKVAGKGLSMNDFTDALKTAYDNAVTWITTNGTSLINHLSNSANPHGVTKAQIGLSNVPNTDFTDSKQDKLTAGSGISIVSSTISATGGGTSGEYTGTLTNVTNITSSTFIHAFWSKIGAYTTVSFAFEAFPTMTGVCALHLTTPTNIDGSIVGSVGHGTFYGAFGFAVPMIVQFQNTTSVRIFFNATSLNQGVANGSFTYK